ncbi:glycoside hydrolase family 43 protein [Aridibaculum aurantiacum]|uniref:glycoside hydrolase family 43 protein n=1 Tax=Aridibaculum aurantiacum TaxID=2810307 RepID=UPI001A968ABD|nr:glycoside hydrolase family 43 protein [Aridibaculum aurantiacum]
MKKLTIILLILCCAFTSQAQQTKQYTNPILSGFYPDPSIVRVGEDYYMVNSTFSYFPGIPVFHSRDLVNWKLISHVITRTEQMDFTGKGVSRSIFAPTIRYHKGLFYVTCTMVDGKGNFVVTAADPAGPWSNPSWLPIDGIDPSLYFDEDDKCYITYNSIPPDNKSLYNGHRTIRINEFDYKNLKVVGENTILVNGGTDIAKEPSWIEGPHIVKRYGYYYLISAEGGTGADHSVVAFRSKNILGPYEPYEKNPILTQRHLTGDRKHPITSTGHADLVELPDGRWYAVFLGTRPYEQDYFNTGRETFLTPVEWKNEWPIINPGHDEVQYHYPLPLPQRKFKNQTSYSGNFSYKENFDKPNLQPDWIFLRHIKEPWYSLNNKKGFLTLTLRPETVAGNLNPSYVARRQQHATFEAATAMIFQPSASNEKAGLLCFMKETNFYFLCKSIDNKQPVVQLYKSTKETKKLQLLASQVLPSTATGAIQFKVVANADNYSFYYSTNNKNWNLVKDNVDGKFLSTKVAGGFANNFVGSTIGLYATSSGAPSGNIANFDWFEYKGNDEVYNTSNRRK